MKNRLTLLTATCLMLASPAFANSATSMTELLSRSPSYDSVLISPDGKSLAVAVYQDDKRSMLCLDRESGAIKSAFKLAGDDEVGTFYWANNERLLVKINTRTAWEKQANYYGEMYGVNCDGSDKELLVGYRRANGRMSEHVQNRFAWADLVHLLPEDPKHVLISSTPWTSDGASKSQLLELDIYTGQIKAKDRTPIAYADVLADRTGRARVATGVNEDKVQTTFIAGEEPEQWQANSALSSYDDMTLLKMLPDGSGFFFSGRDDSDLINLYRYDFASNSVSNLYQSKAVDASHVQFSTDGQSFYAVRLDDGYPSYVLQNTDSEDTQVFRMLLQKFNGSNVVLTSRSKDGNYWIAAVSADNMPVSYFLLDKAKRSLKRLFDSRPELTGLSLAMTEPIQYTASDNQVIHGYLTKPNAAQTKAPLVVLVHGGPHSRDYWSFDPEVQMLAANGYQVLQVNYRGSSGYGKAFSQASNLHWGDRVQQDIIEGAQWAIAQGQVDSNKLCIMGGSFGGYSALQASILNPQLFKCAIGVAGIYDLALLPSKGDIRKLTYGGAYLTESIGSDPALWQKFSPSHHASSITAHVLLIHGKRDQRAPIEHAEAMNKALVDANKSVEYIVFDDETHGFYAQENQFKYFQKVLQFLDKQLK